MGRVPVRPGRRRTGGGRGVGEMRGRAVTGLRGTLTAAGAALGCTAALVAGPAAPAALAQEHPEAQHEQPALFHVEHRDRPGQSTPLFHVEHAQGQGAADSAYDFAPGTRTVRGQRASADAAELRTDGTPYRSSVRGADGPLYYRVELTAREDVYLSAVAVPPADAPVTYADGLRLTLQDQDGNRCDANTATIGAPGYPRPLGVVVERAVRAGSVRCAAAGTYYLVAERETGKEAATAPWDLDLRVLKEPPLKQPTAASPPAPLPSVSLPEPGGQVRERTGGTSFATADAAAAAEVGAGTWRDRLRPGATRFYRLPLDWGDQVSVRAELSSAVAVGTGRPFVPSGLTVTLSTPARAEVLADGATYTGRPVSAELAPGSPVAYENRFASRRGQSAMRSPGAYYVQVSLSPELAAAFGDGPLGVTLRIAVRDRGTSGPSPVYAGDPGVFQADGATPAAGGAAGQAGADGEWRLLAVGAFVAGAALLLWLGLWTLRARREQPARRGV